MVSEIEYRFFRPLGQMDEKKIDSLAGRLLNDYLYVSDENRDAKKVWAMLYRIFSGEPGMGIHVAYEIGEFDGLLIFRDVLPGFKCDVSLKYWNDYNFGKEIVREGRRLVEEFAAGGKLVRMNSETADPRVVKLSKLVGFETEGVRKDDFMWNGKLYDKFMLGRNFPVFPDSSPRGV